MFHGSKNSKWIENRLDHIVSDLIRAFFVVYSIIKHFIKMNGGKIVDTNLICKLPVQTSRD